MSGFTTIDLNDAGLRLAQDGKLRAEIPGCALISDNKLLLGAEALGRAYLEPHGFHNRFWHHLDQTAIPKAGKVARHHADLVYHQLEQLKREFGLTEGVLLVVSSACSRAQLALLLGIAQSCKIEVRGMIDAAVATTSTVPCSGSVQFVDLDMHRALITKLDVDGAVTREATEVVERHGLDRLSHLTIEYIADCFLDQARFDPLEQAATEQLLFDHLPSWLQALESQPTVRVNIEFKRQRFEATISRNGIVSTIDPIWSAIENKLDYSTDTVLSHRCRLFPGLVDQISRAAVADENAVFHAVQNNIDLILQPPDQISLRVELPAAAADGASKPVSVITQSKLKPTHLLSESVAYPLNQPELHLAIGGKLAPQAGAEVFATITEAQGEFHISPRPRHVARLNNLAVEEPVTINTGDRISSDDGQSVFVPIHVKQNHEP